MDNRHVADGAEGVEQDYGEDGNPAILVVVVLAGLHEVVVCGMAELGGSHQGGAYQEERLPRTDPENKLS